MFFWESVPEVKHGKECEVWMKTIFFFKLFSHLHFQKLKRTFLVCNDLAV